MTNQLWPDSDLLMDKPACLDRLQSKIFLDNIFLMAVKASKNTHMWDFFTSHKQCKASKAYNKVLPDFRHYL